MWKYCFGHETLNIYFLWDISSCIPWKSSNLSECHIASIFRVENYTSQAGHAACYLLHAGLLFGLYFLFRNRGHTYPTKSQMALIRLQGLISQKNRSIHECIVQYNDNYSHEYVSTSFPVTSCKPILNMPVAQIWVISNNGIKHQCNTHLE